LRLAIHEVGLHREIRTRQIQRVAIASQSNLREIVKQERAGSPNFIE
jgi:hypothetical protein